jgi:hypothetical protein
MRRGITTCPRCGASVTHYALGCGVCGADIEAARRSAAGRRTLPATASLPRLDDDGLKFLITLLLALATPPFGLALAAWFAWEAHGEGRSGLRTVMLLLALVALVPLVAGYSLWGGFLTSI